MLIDAFLAIAENGLVLCQVKASHVLWDEVLVAGFLSAINSFSATTWAGEGVSRIELSEKQIVITRDPELNLTYVLVTVLEVPPDMAEMCLTEMQRTFKTTVSLDYKASMIDSDLSTQFSQVGQEVLQFWDAQTNKTMLEAQEPFYQALYSYEELQKREQTSFILDKTILQKICIAGAISLTQLRQKVAFLEDVLGERIDLQQISAICDRYVQEGLIKHVKA